MRDWRDDLEDRTQAFADDAVELSIGLAPVPGLRKAALQLNDAATSVGANHRAMRRARSDREFAAKLQIVVEEVDECVYWLELSSRRPRLPTDVKPLLREARELRAIFAKARATTRQKQQEGKDAPDERDTTL
jgi:four helix bundle protein